MSDHFYADYEPDYQRELLLEYGLHCPALRENESVMVEIETELELADA